MTTAKRQLAAVSLLLFIAGFFPAQAADLKLFTPEGYLHGVPFLVRVEFHDSTGKPDKALWDAQADLSVDQPGITLSTNRLALKNGLGTVLLTIDGSSDFTLRARVDQQEATRTIQIRSNETVTTVSGALAGASSSWSGIIRVTGTVTIPAGHTLTIQPGTLVLIDGVASGTSGISIVVNGAVQSLGTESSPVAITCSNPALNWGQIVHENAQPSRYEYTFISKAGRAPGEGHTGTGPALRPSNSSLQLEDCVVSDLTANGSTIGKIMMASDSTLAFNNCVFSRARMGPEIEGTGLECSNSYFIAMNGPDDADGIYLHDAGARALTLSGCVLAGGDDDAVDTLNSTVNLEDCIIRDWPNPNEDAKGVSVFHGEVSLRRCLIANCYAGVSAKSSGPLGVVRLDHCTITALTTGVSAATKSNASAGNLEIYMTNSIVRAPDALHSDFGPERFVSVTYCNTTDPWPGAGNNTADPLFVNAAAGDFRLQPGSPCIDAGDPSFAPDPDFSRTDLGFLAAESPTAGFFVSITAPSPDSIFRGPTNVVLAATAGTASGGITRVEFFSQNLKLGEAAASPYTVTWSNVLAGAHRVHAIASRSDGARATSGPVNFSITSGSGPSTNVWIAAGSQWRYLDNGSDQAAFWPAINFNDTSWKSGRAEFGYGDGGEATLISFGPSTSSKYVTTYFRTSFLLNDEVSRIQSATLNLLRDDGAVVYLNGQEIYRASMPSGAVNYRTYATDAGEYSWEAAAVSPAVFRPGTNLVAVEIHQGNASSSDLSFDFALIGVLAPPTNEPPIVAITAPAAGTIFAAPASVTLSASATDLDGTVTNVAFYANGTRLAGDSTAPYSSIWNSIAAGDYALAAVALDNFGQASTSAIVQITVSADTAAPTVAAQFPVSGPATNLTEITVTFSKPVLGVDASDFRINGLPATAVSGSGIRYTFTLPQLPPGPATISWSADHGISDGFTPAKPFDHTAPAASWQYQLIDTLAPVLQSAFPLANSTVASLASITVTFNEPILGINAADLLISGVPASSLSGSGAGPYVFSFSQPLSGNVTASWASNHGIRDFAGNPISSLSWSYLLDPAQTGVVISEIMYHPASEDRREEYIELFNRGAAPVSLGGWRFVDGVDFTFPEVAIPAGGYLVVAADRAVFQAKYPDVTNVIGDWTGTLSNSREEIELEDAQGTPVALVAYADEGDWAIRQRSDLHFGRRGWRWFAAHDGLGYAAELINPAAPADNGQNWAASLALEGTPGRQNSVYSNRTAPIIENVAHFPAVPRSSDPVIIFAKISGAAGPQPIVQIHYRVNNAAPGEFAILPMHDDAQEGDATAGDGLFAARLPAQNNDTVVEFYLTASDSLGNTRTWPAPAIPAADGTGPTGPVANALYQVDDRAITETQPLYKVIMTEAERLELEAIGYNIGGSANSDAQMNATFISIDGTGTNVRYLTGVRNRGHGTRGAKPNNFRINFRSDDEWKGVLGLNLNAQFSWLQVLGSAIHIKSGIVGAYSRAVQLRVNNANLVFTGGIERTYGSYAANEVINSDWADRHFPDDSEGNVYRAIRDIQPPEFDYRTLEAYPFLSGPENKNSYTNTWFKETNNSEDDWSDLIAMLRVLGPNGTDPFTPDSVRRVIKAEQWLRHLALMNLLGNSETGLNSGYNDDYYMYRGVKDPRFVLMYYDLDQILGFNGSYGALSQLFSAANENGAGRALGRLLHDPDFEPLYFDQLRELIDTTLSEVEFNALVDQVLGDFVPFATRVQLKDWMSMRRDFVRSQLPASPSPAPPRAVLSGAPRSPTPHASATLQVGGEDVTHYRYSLNGNPFGPETAVQNPIMLALLPAGTNTLAVIGNNSAGLYQATAEATTLTWVVNPALPAVRLNEVLASGSGDVRDQVELFNEGTTPLDLTGLRLTDSLSQPGRFTFSGIVLAPGAFLVVDSAQLGFSFDASGEGVYLLDKTSNGGALLDSVEFGQQIPGLSLGRFGSSGEWFLSQPTFGAANVVQPLGDTTRTRINEWLTFGLSPFPDDFLELYNPEALPVALGGSFLTPHRAGAPQQNRIAPLTFIPARGYLAFRSGNGNAADEINFALASEQGEITLLAPDLTVIDSVVYGPQKIGIPTGRCPDGSPNQKALVAPTPGAPNDCPFDPGTPEMVAIVPFNHSWKYLSNGSDPGPSWMQPAFDDSTWPSGPGVLGFENDPLPDPVLTPFPNTGAITYYFRTSFSFDPALVPSEIQVTHLIDDGAAFYLNGLPVGAPFNLALGAGAQSFATRTVGEASYQTFTLPLDLLRPGVNSLAVEVHQVNSSSSDMVMGLRLDALVLTNRASQAGIVINEVLANNATLAEASGATPDWVELFNPSTNAVDLGGMSLTDDPMNPVRWVFPTGSVLPGNGFLRVLCDPSTPPGFANTGFGLTANGGSVFLFRGSTEGGGLQNSLTYGLQPADWSVGRVPDGSTNWVLAIPSAGIANTAASLGNAALIKINEWMADPASGADWFELFNPNPEPVDISNLRLSDSLTDRAKQIIPPLSFLGTSGHGFQKFEADELVSAGADHVDFRLSASGESLALSTAELILIDGLSFGPQQTGVSQGRLLDGSSNVVSFSTTSSPGSANYLPLPGVVINELLSHSDPPLMDALELHNPTAEPVDISGFFLSDSPLNLRKFQLGTNTVIPPGGYWVVYEDEFNSDTAFDPFSFSSARGESVYLSETRDGLLTGYRASASFGAAENGVSFGRLQTSQGYHFVPMASRTFGRDNPATTNEFKTGLGAPNSLPRIGAVIISEVMFAPPGTNDALEFVELHNRTSSPVALYDAAHPTNTWRLRRGIEFDFPPGTILPAGGHLVVASFDPSVDAVARAAFETAYGPQSALFGPYLGRLNNAGDAIELQKPDAPDENSVPFVRVDAVDYDDALPWPASARATGASIQRINLALYGNDPMNWVAAAPTAGGPLATAADSDGDGLPDAWETEHGLNPLNPLDAQFDSDSDLFTNLAEFLAGTNPRDASDALKLTATSVESGIVLRFTARAGRSYSILHRDDSPVAPWQVFRSIPAAASSGLVEVTDANPSSPMRFYRVIVQP